MYKKILSVALAGCLLFSETALAAETMVTESNVEVEVQEDVLDVSTLAQQEDVKYLSQGAFNALSEKMQDKYLDEVNAVAGYVANGAEDIVFAKDSEGSLHFSMHIDFKPILPQAENVKSIKEYQPVTEPEVSEVETITEGYFSELETEIITTVETVEVTGETETITEPVEETEISSDTVVETEEETEIGSSTTEIETEVETVTEIETELATEVFETENEETVEISTEQETESSITEQETESSTEETDVSSTEQETEVATTEEIESYVNLYELTVDEENMEYLAQDTNEYIELAPFEMIDLDLGDSSNLSPIKISKASGSPNYFYNQLSDTEKSIFSRIRDSLLSGSYTVSFSGEMEEPQTYMQAIAALFLEYPGRLDHVNFYAGMSVRSSYSGGGYTTQIIFEKFPYYSKEIDTKAANRVRTYIVEAQKWAKENYPYDVAYGFLYYLNYQIAANAEYNYSGMANSDTQSEEFWYNQTKYGTLTAGYGVCESYAKAMAYALDTVGLSNYYVLGYVWGRESSRHAWNMVLMPNGSWYLLDPTWCDDGTEGEGDTAVKSHNYMYFLKSDVGIHTPTGRSFTSSSVRGFSYPRLSVEDYIAATDPETADTPSNLSLNHDFYILQSGKKLKLEPEQSVAGCKVTWTSSDKSIAKVDNKGFVTGVKGGSAVITCSVSVAGIVTKASCTVDVFKVVSVVSSRNSKTSDTIAVTPGATVTVPLTVNMGSTYSVSQLIADGKCSEPTITNSKTEVVTPDIQITEANTINLTLKAKKAGSATVKLKFMGKTCTIKVQVGNPITQDMFIINKIDNDSIQYTGKAVKPKIKKSATAPKDLKYKVTYVNNTNVGTATVRIAGSGKYGGEIIYNFDITPVSIELGTIRKISSKTYNAANNQASTVVKLGKKTLKKDRDYIILYNNSPTVINVGTYDITVQGVGNYTGAFKSTYSYTVKPNKINKLSIKCPSTILYTGEPIEPVSVKIGKNVVPDTDYTVTYYTGMTPTLSNKVTNVENLGQYTAVITVKGNNIVNTATKSEIVKRFKVK